MYSVRSQIYGEPVSNLKKQHKPKNEFDKPFRKADTDIETITERILT
jgi:hypothetical protein